MNPKESHALSIDLEDWYQAFQAVPHSSWPGHASRIEESTGRVLELLERTGARATFFVLGDLARRFPSLIRRIASAGHTLGTHGVTHRPLWQLSPSEFREEIHSSVETLSSLSSRPVPGFRAPWFSLVRKTAWADEILLEEGIRYDSSSFPFRNPVYGDSGVELGIHRRASGLLEIPPSVARWGPFRVPVAGGFYLRTLPCRLFSAGLQRIVRDGRPLVLYFHPWEMDVDQPFVWKGMFETLIHFLGRRRFERRLTDVLARYRFAPIEEVFPGTVAP